MPLRTGRCPADAPVHGPLFWRGDSPYMGHLRIMSEGCQGALKAWLLRRDKTAWLAFARKFGDFLVEHQAADGSIAGECESPTVVSGVGYPCPCALSSRQTVAALLLVWSLCSSQQISS